MVAFELCVPAAGLMGMGRICEERGGGQVVAVGEGQEASARTGGVWGRVSAAERLLSMVAL